VHTLACANMIRAVKAVSTYRGRDPRDAILVAFGGNGPIVGADMAAQLDIERVAIPPDAGVFSAFGLLVAGTAQHFARAILRPTTELAAAGLVVVSGMARGVDGEAHRGALEAGGTTVAVLGCGVDRVYPASHAGLAKEIVASGLIVSEYAPGVEPAPWRFPARNRVIAGVASAVVVVEARERSGALITADLALDEGREVFAVPGEITSALSLGANGLIRLGATLITGAGDVLEALGIEASSPPVRPELDPASRTLFDALRDAPATADQLVHATGLPAAQVGPALTILELTGLVSEGEGLYRVVMPPG